MKRIALLFAFLFTFSSAFISCRETEESNGERLEEGMEDAGDEMEDAVDDLGDEIDR
ncbi:hypothetical protein HC174_04665 [Salinimicrobium sp. CDJ15-81-2]|nr:hypothetical protein [Salinimicrobium nanhaiense]